MKHNRDLGILGEDAAIKYLEKKDYKIIERNFRLRNGEIDIIAVQTEKSLSGNTSQTLVFIEVKTRLTTDFGSPFEAITYWKIKALRRSAEVYKATHKKLPELMRLDAIAIILAPDNSISNIEHIENMA